MKPRTFFMVTALAATLMLISTFEDVAATNEENLVRLRVIPDYPHTVEYTVRTLRELGAEVVLLKSPFTVAQQLVTDFFPCSRYETPASLEASYYEQRQSFFKSMDDELGNRNGMERVAIQRKRLDLAWQYRKNFYGKSRSDSVLIHEAVVLVRRQDISKLRSFGRVERVPKNSPMDGLSKRAGPDIAVDTWAPMLGYTFAKAQQVLNLLWWSDDVSGLTGNSTSTYEHSFSLMSEDLDLGSGRMGIEYGVTNFPRPYFTTHFTDQGEEVAFTVGSSAGADLVPNRWFFSFVRVAGDYAQSEGIKVTAQFGHRTRPDCSSAWCVSEDASYEIIPEWREIPDRFFWSRR